MKIGKKYILLNPETFEKNIVQRIDNNDPRIKKIVFKNDIVLYWLDFDFISTYSMEYLTPLILGEYDED